MRIARIVVTVAALAMTACGAGGATTEATTATTTGTRTPIDRVVLRLEDLPAGWVALDEAESDPEAASESTPPACNSPDGPFPSATAERATSSFRGPGEHGQYLASFAVRFTDASVAGQALDDYRAVIDRCAHFRIGVGADAADYSSEPTVFTALGDDTFAARTRGARPDGDAYLDVLFVTTRIGDEVIALSLFGPQENPVDPALAERLQRLLLARS